MFFRTATSVAILACAATVASAEAQPQPYKLAMMPVLGMSLMRRDTSGYQPEQSQCHEGNSCEEACGSGFTQCPSKDNVVHCFNPAAKQNCCSDGTGNSCDEGYYCTHDTKSQTWCCPNNMDLAACAAAYSVTGGLEVASSTSAAPTSTEAPTYDLPTVTPPATTSVPVVTETKDQTTTICDATSSGYTSAWTSSNGTYTTAVPTAPSQGPVTTGYPLPSPTGINGAAASGVSALLLLAAGVVALL